MATTAYDPEIGFFEVLPEERRSLLCQRQINVVDGIISNVGLGDSDCGELSPPPAQKNLKQLPDYPRQSEQLIPDLSPAG